MCNAQKRKHSHKTAINFPSDGRLRPIFFVGTKTRTMPWELNLVDLTFLKNYTKNKEVSRAWTVQWYGFCFYRRIYFIASDTYGADVIRSLAFSYCLVSSEQDLAHGGFSSTFQQNFPGLLVCNAWKRERSRKRAINFCPTADWGQVFFCWNENDKNYVMGGKFSWFDLPVKLHKKIGF